MAAPRREEIEQKHTHNWIRKDQVEFYCSGLYKGYPCIHIKIGAQEFDRREDEYNNYYELIRTTPAFIDWQEMSIAFKVKDLEKVRKIKERIAQRTDGYLPKPNFPDPATPFLYVVEGI